MSRRSGRSEIEFQKGTMYGAYLERQRERRERPLTAEGLPESLTLTLDGFSLPFRMPVRTRRVVVGAAVVATLTTFAWILWSIWNTVQVLVDGGTVSFGGDSGSSGLGCPVSLGAVAGFLLMSGLERLSPDAVLEARGTRVTLRHGSKVLADVPIEAVDVQPGSQHIHLGPENFSLAYLPDATLQWLENALELRETHHGSASDIPEALTELMPDPTNPPSGRPKNP